VLDTVEARRERVALVTLERDPERVAVERASAGEVLDDRGEAGDELDVHGASTTGPATYRWVRATAGAARTCRSALVPAR
jgi:hypothetical protein